MTPAIDTAFPPTPFAVVRRLASLTAIAALAIGALAGPAAGQASESGRIEGRIFDEATHEPLPGASVSIVGTQRGAITDPMGRFRITDLPAGQYRLRAARIGYGEMVTREISVRSGATATLELALRPQAETLPTVVSTVAGATRAELLESVIQSRAEVSLATTELAARTAQDFNAANTYDALRLVPGVSFLWEAGGRHGQPSRIRGASAWTISDAVEDFPTLRISGIGAEDGGLTAGLGAAIPAIAVRSIDVKKGSLGVLYSGDANGVVVNQLKRGQPGRPTGTLWLEASAIAEQLVMADIGGGGAGFDYYIAGKLLNGSYEDLVDPAGRSMSDDDFASGLARLGWSPTEDLRIEALALRGRDRIAYTMPRKDDPNTPDVDESLTPHAFRTTNTSGFYGLTLDHAIGERASYELGYSMHENTAVRYSLTQGRAHRDRPQDTHTLFANLYVTRELAPTISYSGKTGVEALWQEQRELANNSDKHQQFEDRSIFHAGTISFGRSLFVNGGVRYVDASDDWGDHGFWAYNAGLAWRIPVSGTTARLAYTTGHSREKGFAFFFGPIDDAGGMELSESRTLEAGIDQQWTLAGRAGQLGVTAFRAQHERVPTFSGWGAATVYYEEHEVTGVEVSAEQRLGPIARVLGSFAWTDTEVLATTHPDGIGVGSTAVPVPRYTGALALELTPLDRLRLSAIGTYDDGMRQEEIDTQTGEWTIMTSAAFTRLNLAADYHFTDRATARVRVENALDENDLGYSSETIGPEGHSRTPTIARDAGRFVSVGVILRY